MKYYILKINTYQLIKQEDGTFKQSLLGTCYDKKYNSKAKIIEAIKEMITNDVFMVENGGAFSKLTLFPDGPTTCILETKYFVAHLVSRRIDRIYVETTNVKDASDDNIEAKSGLTFTEYKKLYNKLLPFMNSIIQKGSERIVLCSK